MSTINWNCRGFGNPRTVYALKRALQKEALQFIFLMETKLSQEAMKYKQQELEYTQGLAVSSHGQSRGLALQWKSDSKVAIQGFSRWHIDAHVACTITRLTWRLTGFYGQPDTSRREETWSILESLGHFNHLSWLCIGDYNEIISQAKTSRCRIRSARQLD